jgi:glutaredoxin
MRPRELAALLLLGLTAAAPAAAQYKWVGPGGEVTYSDRPPPAGSDAVKVSPVASTAARRDDASLPAALREPASKHPVVLYTTADCAPCQMARAHLTRRGVPFSERTVSTAADAEALRRAGFQEVTMPGLGVGRDRTVGYESSAWDRLLDAAGYPQTSMLPASYPARGAASGRHRRPRAGRHRRRARPAARAAPRGAGAVGRGLHPLLVRRARRSGIRTAARPSR